MEASSYKITVNLTNAAHRLKKANALKVADLNKEVKAKSEKQISQSYKDHIVKLNEIFQIADNDNFFIQGTIYGTISGTFLRDIYRLKFIITKNSFYSKQVPRDYLKLSQEKNLPSEGIPDENKGGALLGNIINPVSNQIGLFAARSLGGFATVVASVISAMVATAGLAFITPWSGLTNYFVKTPILNQAQQVDNTLLKLSHTLIDSGINAGVKILNSMNITGGPLDAEEIIDRIKEAINLNDNIIPPINGMSSPSTPVNPVEQTITSLMIRILIVLYNLFNGSSIPAAIASATFLGPLGYSPLVAALYALLPGFIRKVFNMIFKGPGQDNSNLLGREVMPPPAHPVARTQAQPLQQQQQQYTGLMKYMPGNEPVSNLTKTVTHASDTNDPWNSQLYALLNEGIQNSIFLRQLNATGDIYLRTIYLYLTNLRQNPTMFGNGFNNQVGPLSYHELSDIIMPNLLGTYQPLFNHLQTIPNLQPHVQRWMQIYLDKGQQNMNLTTFQGQTLSDPQVIATQILRDKANRKIQDQGRLPTVSELSNIYAPSGPFILNRRDRANPNLMNRIKIMFSTYHDLNRQYSFDPRSNLITPLATPHVFLDLNQYGFALIDALNDYHTNPSGFTRLRFGRSMPSPDYLTFHDTLMSQMSPENITYYLGIPKDFLVKSAPLLSTVQGPPEQTGVFDNMMNYVANIGQRGFESISNIVSPPLPDDPPPPILPTPMPRPPIRAQSPPMAPTPFGSGLKRHKGKGLTDALQDVGNEISQIFSQQAPPQASQEMDPTLFNSQAFPTLPPTNSAREMNMNDDIYNTSFFNPSKRSKKLSVGNFSPMTFSDDFNKSSIHYTPNTKRKPRLWNNIHQSPYSQNKYLQFLPQKPLDQIPFATSRDTDLSYKKKRPNVFDPDGVQQNFSQRMRKINEKLEQKEYKQSEKYNRKRKASDIKKQKFFIRNQYKLNKLKENVLWKKMLYQTKQMPNGTEKEVKINKLKRDHFLRTIGLQKQKDVSLRNLQMSKRGMGAVTNQKADGNVVTSSLSVPDAAHVDDQEDEPVNVAFPVKVHRDILKTQTSISRPVKNYWNQNVTSQSAPVKVQPSLYLWGVQNKQHTKSKPPQMTVYDRLSHPFTLKSISNYGGKAGFKLKPEKISLRYTRPIPYSEEPKKGGKLKRKVSVVYDSEDDEDEDDNQSPHKKKSLANSDKKITAWVSTFMTGTQKFLKSIKLSKIKSSPGLIEVFRCWKLMEPSFLFFCLDSHNTTKIQIFKNDGNGFIYETPEETIDLKSFEAFISFESIPAGLTPLTKKQELMVVSFLAMLGDLHVNELRPKLKNLVHGVAFSAFIEKKNQLIPVNTPGFFVTS